MSLCFLLSLGLGAYSGIFFGHALPERYTMNFLFTGLPFFLLGELLSNAYERKSGWMRNQSFLLACSLISFLLMIFEREIVYYDSIVGNCISIFHVLQRKLDIRINRERPFKHDLYCTYDGIYDA